VYSKAGRDRPARERGVDATCGSIQYDCHHRLPHFLLRSAAWPSLGPNALCATHLKPPETKCPGHGVRDRAGAKPFPQSRPRERKNMVTVRKRGRSRNGHATPLPLLDHIDRARVRALPLAARRLAQGHGLPASTALHVALAAGFKCGDDR
jgi:hypothetical protein